MNNVRLVPLMYLLSFYTIAFSQEDKNGNLSLDLKDVKFSNTSGVVLDVFHDMLKDKKIDIDNTTVAIDISQQNIEKYKEDLENRFAHVQKTLHKELYLNNRKALESYALTNLAQLKTPTAGIYVDQLVAPLGISAIVEYAKDPIDRYLGDNENQIVDLSNSALSIINKNNPNFRQYSKQQISDLINSLKLYISKGALNDILFARLHKKCLEITLESPQLLNLTNRALDENEFITKFDGLKLELEKIAQKEFYELGQSIKELSKNETEVLATLGVLQQEIADDLATLRTWEKRIAAAGKNENVEALRQRHADLLVRSAFKTDVVNSFMNSGIEAIQKFEYYNNAAKQIFGNALEQKNMIGTLTSLKKPTLTSVIAFSTGSIGNIKNISNTLASVGILPDAAANVSKFVDAASIGISVVSSLFPPNPMGIMSAIGGLGGLLSKPGPSPFEKQMYEEMKKGFAEINNRLDQIEDKITLMQARMEEMHSEIMQSMRYVSVQLEEIKEIVELNNKIASYEIYAKYNMTDEFIKTKNTALHGLDYYTTWYTYPAALEILSKLFEFTTEKNLSNISSQDFVIAGESNKTFKDYAKKQIAAYNNTLKFFNIVNTEIETDKSLKSILLVPAKHNKFNSKLRGYESGIVESTYDFESVSSNYLSPSFLARLAENFVQLYPFYILRYADDSYRPCKTAKELIDKISLGHVAQQTSICHEHLSALSKFLDNAIIQQGLMSGHTLMPHLNDALFGTEIHRKEALKVVNTNSIIAKNLCGFLINTKVPKEKLSSTIEILRQHTISDKDVATLNDALVYGRGRLSFIKEKHSTSTTSISLMYSNKGERAILPLPNVEFIANEEMYYSEDLYRLITAKKKVLSTLSDITFFYKLPQEIDEAFKSVYLRL